MTRDEIIETMAREIFPTVFDERAFTPFEHGWAAARASACELVKSALSALEAKGMVVVGKDEVTREHQASAPSNPRATDAKPSLSPGSFTSGA